jgi:hypothetical protein
VNETADRTIAYAERTRYLVVAQPIHGSDHRLPLKRRQSGESGECGVRGHPLLELIVGREGRHVFVQFHSIGSPSHRAHRNVVDDPV